jgi:hypothetical protein
VLLTTRLISPRILCNCHVLTLAREHIGPAGSSYNLSRWRISLNKPLNDILRNLYDIGPEPPVIASIPFEPWERSYSIRHTAHGFLCNKRHTAYGAYTACGICDTAYDVQHTIYGIWRMCSGATKRPPSCCNSLIYEITW